MRKFITGLALALSMTGTLWAQEVVSPDPAIETTIQSQIDAFLQQDVGTAFTFAAPNIRNIFRTAENFGTMVRQGYPMVWQPDNVAFGDLREFRGVMYQTVFVTDRAGQVHSLEYQMQRVDGAWKIAGVRFLQAPDLSA